MSNAHPFDGKPFLDVLKYLFEFGTGIDNAINNKVLVDSKVHSPEDVIAKYKPILDSVLLAVDVPSGESTIFDEFTEHTIEEIIDTYPIWKVDTDMSYEETAYARGLYNAALLFKYPLSSQRRDRDAAEWVVTGNCGDLVSDETISCGKSIGSGASREYVGDPLAALSAYLLKFGKMLEKYVIYFIDDSGNISEVKLVLGREIGDFSVIPWLALNLVGFGDGCVIAADACPEIRDDLLYLMAVAYKMSGLTHRGYVQQ